MLEKSNKYTIITLYLIFVLIADIKGFYEIYKYRDSLSALVDWGLFFRVILPITFLYFGWRANNKNEKTAAYCFGISRSVDFNRIIFSENYGLFLSLKIFVFILDLFIGYQIILFYRNYSSSKIIKGKGAENLEKDQKKASLSNKQLLWKALLIIISCFAVLLISTLIIVYFR